MDLTTKYSLCEDINYAIEHSINRVRNMQEPDYIAALIKNLPTRLTSILNRYFPLAKFRIGGCFIHQKPLARFIDPYSYSKAPEIGDLLIVYKEISPNGIIYHNALLLQAKKVTNIYNSPVKTSDEHQLRLYREWPKFIYEKAGSLNGIKRSISPKTITPGAQYLLINETKWDPTLPCFTTFWCAIPNDILVASKSLALQLIDFIEFQTGKPFVPRKGNIDQWSKMIWDLLRVSANAVFNRRNAGFTLSNRTSGDIERPSGDFINLIVDSINSTRDYIDLDENSTDISMLIIEKDNREGNKGKE